MAPYRPTKRLVGYTNRLIGLRPAGEEGSRSVFNQLTAAEVVTAIGATARAIAREGGGEGELSDFERDQLMSAYSATRHLAVELTSYAPEFRRFNEALASVLGDAEGTGGDGEAVERLRQVLRDEGDVAAVGDALSDLLAVWREDDAPETRERRAKVQALLRELADREVEVLAEGLA